MRWKSLSNRVWALGWKAQRIAQLSARLWCMQGKSMVVIGFAICVSQYINAGSSDHLDSARACEESS